MERNDYFTTSELAEFFDIAIETVNKYFENNKETFILDGVYEVQAPDYVLSSAILDNEGVEIPNADNLPQRKHKKTKSIYDYRIYPRRAILRMATLLKNSVIAKAVREQLINLSEVDFIRSAEVKREISLLKGIRNALKSKTQELIQQANEEYRRWRNRYIYTVEPYFPQETALAKLYSKFNMTVSKIKWRVTNQLIPSQRHKQYRSHQEALTAVALKLAQEFNGRTELLEDELRIIEEKPTGVIFR